MLAHCRANLLACGVCVCVCMDVGMAPQHDVSELGTDGGFVMRTAPVSLALCCSADAIEVIQPPWPAAEASRFPFVRLTLIAARVFNLLCCCARSLSSGSLSSGAPVNPYPALGDSVSGSTAGPGSRHSHVSSVSTMRPQYRRSSTRCRCRGHCTASCARSLTSPL
jgi:hypothetical protein